VEKNNKKLKSIIETTESVIPLASFLTIEGRNFTLFGGAERLLQILEPAKLNTQ